MKLQELRKLYLHEEMSLDWVININEVLDTVISISEWKTIDKRHVGKLEIDNEVFLIYIEPIFYKIQSIPEKHQIDILNIAFAKIDESNNPSQQLVLTSKNGSKILGAITNALLNEISKYKFDLIMFISKDNYDKRMNIYNMIANRKFKNYERQERNVRMPDGSLATFIISNDLSNEIYNLLKQDLVNLSKNAI